MASITDTLSRQLAEQAVATARLAPSIHNTQPWRWHFDGQTLSLRADPDRLLGVVDPAGRQLLVSCGTALLHARLALRAHGLDPAVRLLPEGTGPDRLEIDLSGDSPLATISAGGGRPADEDEKALLAAVELRHTDRRPFDPRPLEAAVLADLRRAAEAEGAWLMALESTEARIDAAVLTARADWAEHLDPAYQAELAAWSRPATGPGSTAADGIPRHAVVAHDPGRPSDFPLRDFDTLDAPGLRADAGGADGPPAGGPPAAERPAVVILGTDSDRPVDQLAVGQALARVLLTVTARGAAASPLGQPVDIDADRILLRQLMNIPGHVQMILRVGYPAEGAAPLRPTPRRPLSEILTID
jgi:nitroreductase